MPEVAMQGLASVTPELARSHFSTFSLLLGFGKKKRFQDA